MLSVRLSLLEFLRHVCHLLVVKDNGKLKLKFIMFWFKPGEWRQWMRDDPRGAAASCCGTTSRGPVATLLGPIYSCSIQHIAPGTAVWCCCCCDALVPHCHAVLQFTDPVFCAFLQGKLREPHGIVVAGSWSW